MSELPELQNTIDETGPPCKTCDKPVGESQYLCYELRPEHHAGVQGPTSYYWHEACYNSDPWIEIDFVTLDGEHYRYLRPVSVVKEIFSELSENRPGFMIEPHRLRYFNNQMLKTVETWRFDLFGKEVEEI